MVKKFSNRLGVVLGILVTGSVIASETIGVQPGSESEAVPSTSSLLNLMDNSAQQNSVDPHVVAPDEQLFDTSCTQCHDTERSTAKNKTYDEWLATVRRMADKSGANIPVSQHEPIAEYLASLNSTAESTDDLPDTKSSAARPVSLNAAISLIWRGGSAEVENGGFFPDVWVGAEWRPENNPLRATVTACTSCHEGNNSGMSLELVEASFTADLIHLATGESQLNRESDLKADVKAGRFIVPFGAFSGSAHPGSYRTLTNPLMYNMGRRVGATRPRQPVLPMPYSDEGIDLRVDVPLPAQFTTHLDVYAVNGLQTGGPRVFTDSRSYSDNNSNTALGGRMSLGNSWMRVGGSFSSGELQAYDAPVQDYQLAGGDITFRYKDFVRMYYEYALRKEDSIPSKESRVDGHVVEAEATVWRKPKISLLARFDTLNHSGFLGEEMTERFSWGPNLTLPGGSLLIVNHEHWTFDDPLPSEDIIGFRWVATF